MNRISVSVDNVIPRPAHEEKDSGPLADAVQLTIDSIPVTVEKGTTLLNAARQCGIQIPVLCHQPNERPVGVCRMCSVDAGERTLSAACVKPVEKGMAVTTNSDKVKRARRVLLELLLADHPSPCARQQQSGDCELEALALSEGIGSPRFASPAFSRGQDHSSPIIDVDHDACILCNRCIRACNEVRQNNVLARRGKGYQAGIAFDLDDPMGSSSCIGCGECMVSCPTGALTNKTVIPAELPDGQPVDIRFLKYLPYFEEISGTFLDLNKNAVVLRRFQPGDIICRGGEYGSTAFFILEGEIEMFLQAPCVSDNQPRKVDGFFKKFANLLTDRNSHPKAGAAHPSAPVTGEVLTLRPGDLFGETCCTTYYPRTETVRAATNCVILEILRNVLDMMLQRSAAFCRLLDSNFRERGLRLHLRNTHLFSSLSDAFLDGLKDIVDLTRFQKGQEIFRQGATSDNFYVIRAGFVKISAHRDDGETVLAYLGPGQHFGLEDGGCRSIAATALDHVDLVRIGDDDFEQLIQRFPQDRKKFAVNAEGWRRGDLQARKIDVPLQTFLSQGLMEANSVLVLNLEKCTRCDACVRACADAHGGVTRLVREGLRFDNYLVATSCRQCRDPLCMVGCPVGSIRRRNSLEVVIEDWCIGCGLCAQNCPYGNIHMYPVTMSEDPDPSSASMRPLVKQKATSCDLCSGLVEPSCVYACPHDAAQRVDAAKFFGMLPGPQGTLAS